MTKTHLPCLFQGTDLCPNLFVGDCGSSLKFSRKAGEGEGVLFSDKHLNELCCYKERMFFLVTLFIEVGERGEGSGLAQLRGGGGLFPHVRGKVALCSWHWQIKSHLLCGFGGYSLGKRWLKTCLRVQSNWCVPLQHMPRTIISSERSCRSNFREKMQLANVYCKMYIVHPVSVMRQRLLPHY